MPYNNLTNNFELDASMTKLATEKKSAIELQKRKHEDWTDNYELYRNKVRTNRLTQRQAVNIPLMKETIKTLLSKVDDAPNVDWKELGGDQIKELVYQEVWNQQVKDNVMELVDILDKKNVLLYGLSTKKLNIDEYGVCVDVLDVYDVVFDPLTTWWDLDSARYIVQMNIFKSVREILADDRYDDKGKEELKIWADSPAGMTQSQENKEQWEKKMERLKAMGVDHGDFPFCAGGDRIVNLTEHYTREWDAKKKKFVKKVYVYAEDTIPLMSDTLHNLIGVDFWPFVVWAEDPENTDIYPDAVADLVRTPNKVLNVWFSQLIENRTLKNFQMHWYLPGQNYKAQTYTPGPGVMLPAPPGEDINKVIKPVQIDGLDDTLGAINQLIMIAERGSGATAIDKGTGEKGKQTLGEVEILVGKAEERTTAMAKFYRLAWYELAWKWDKMMHANAPKIMNLYKTSAKGKVYPKRVFTNDWKSETGYEPVVRSSSEQESESVKSIQKWMFIMKQNPTNPALKRIGTKRMLEVADLTPEELREVEESEKKMAEQVMQQQNPSANQRPPMQPSQPVQQQIDPNLLNEVQQKMAELQL